MRELRKAQRQLHQDQNETHQSNQDQSAGALGTSRQVTARNTKKVSEKDKLMIRKKELQVKLEQKRYKYFKNERQKEQFRGILFKNFSSEIRGSPKKISPEKYNGYRFQEIPSNLPNLYFDSIEEKIFTQIKIDLYSSAIRVNLSSFLRALSDL